MEKNMCVPAQKPAYLNTDLKKRVAALLIKHKALMDGLAKYD